MSELKELLDDFILNSKNILYDNLIGIYLHGSLAMGCYNEKKSDIDFDTENSKAIAHVGVVIKCDTVVRLCLLSAKVLGVYGYLLVHSP